MFDEPFDSYDLYARGLRPARCNGCKYDQLEHKLGDKFLVVPGNGSWITIYELDALPIPGQGQNEYEGRPIRFHVSLMSIGHSDECYHWQPDVKGEIHESDFSKRLQAEI